MNKILKNNKKKNQKSKNVYFLNVYLKSAFEIQTLNIYNQKIIYKSSCASASSLAPPLESPCL
jgi:hypothetical protein